MAAQTACWEGPLWGPLCFKHFVGVSVLFLKTDVMEKFGKEKLENLVLYIHGTPPPAQEWSDNENEDLEQEVGEFIYFHYLMIR